jgi:VanZ family protein
VSDNAKNNDKNNEMNKLIPFLSISFFGFILWVIYLANTGQHSVFFELVASIPYGDKLGHFCLFGILTLAANFTFKLKSFQLLSVEVYLGSILVFFFVVLEESSQFFIATRTIDALDLSADFIGIVLFNLVTKYLRKYA